MGPRYPNGRNNIGVVRPSEKHWKTLLRCTLKRLNRSGCRLGADLCGPEGTWVKVGRIHSPPRRVTRWRCGLLSKFFDYSLLPATEVVNVAHVGSPPANGRLVIDSRVSPRIVDETTSQLNGWIETLQLRFSRPDHQLITLCTVHIRTLLHHCANTQVQKRQAA